MSNLQITLAILGIIVVAGVIIYNNWYNSSHSPRKARALDDADAADALGAQRREPSLQAHGPAQDVGAAGHGTSIAPELDAALSPEDRPILPPRSGAPAQAISPAIHGWQDGAHGLDALVFSITQIQLAAPVNGDAALAALPPTRRVGGKQFLVEGLNIQTRIWEAPRTGAHYGEFQAGVQLANRLGALNEIEFSEFVVKAQAFADAIDGDPDFPDMLHEVARAREVDSFAAQNDAILSFMVVAKRTTWSPGYVRQAAARYGFKPSATPGRLIVPAANPANPPVLALSYDPQAALADDLDHSPIREITLTLDVPNVERGENAFARLREAVEGLARAMEGTVADPEGTPLPAMAMEPIAADIVRLYDALEARGLSAGSPVAQKLFS